MVDISDAAVKRGISTVGGSLERLVKKEKMSAGDRDATLKRITGDHRPRQARRLRPRHRGRDRERGTEGQDPEGSLCDAIAADADRHQHLVDLDHKARRSDRPSRPLHRHAFLQSGAGHGAAGTHPRPADLRRHPRQGGSFAKRVGKVPITAKNSPGFAVNRILCPMINEAMFALQEGIATAEEIDAGMKLGCNHPIGPLALADLSGSTPCCR